MREHNVKATEYMLLFLTVCDIRREGCGKLDRSLLKSYIFGERVAKNQHGPTEEESTWCCLPCVPA